jgi:hypothetical protein
VDMLQFAQEARVSQYIMNCKEHGALSHMHATVVTRCTKEMPTHVYTKTNIQVWSKSH